MNSRLKQLLQIAASFGLMGLFLYWAFSGTDPRELWHAITSISPTWVAIIVITTLCTLVLRAWRWRTLMQPFAPQISYCDASIALAICYAANVAIPRSGEILRCVSLKWTRGASISALMATVVVERILDLFWLIIYVGAALVILRDRINREFPWMEPASLAGLAGCFIALIALILISIYREKALAKIRPPLEKISPQLASTVLGLLETFIDGLSALQKPSAYLEIIASSILLNAGYVLIIYETFIGLGFDQLYGLELPASLVIMAISSIGVIAPTPGAAGSYHFLFSQGLHRLYLVPLNAALACATLAHAIATLTYVAIGGPALLLQWLQNRGKREAA